jgi:hypothetical protein
MKNFTDQEVEVIEETEDFHLPNGEVVPAMYLFFSQKLINNKSLSLIPDYDDDEYIF